MPRKRGKLTSATKLKLEQIVRLQMVEKPVVEIAALMGMEADEVSNLIRHPDYEALRREYCDKVYQGFDRMVAQRNTGQLLEAASPDAAEALIALLHNDDAVQRRLSATAVLDRTGHGPIQRKAVRQRIELDPASAALLGAAIAEADTVIDVEVLDESKDDAGTESGGGPSPAPTG